MVDNVCWHKGNNRQCVLAQGEWQTNGVGIRGMVDNLCWHKGMVDNLSVRFDSHNVGRIAVGCDSCLFACYITTDGERIFH